MCLTFYLISNVTVVITGKRARDELGWVPKHTGVVSEMSLYYNAYKASLGGGS